MARNHTIIIVESLVRVIAENSWITRAENGVFRVALQGIESSEITASVANHHSTSPQNIRKPLIRVNMSFHVEFLDKGLRKGVARVASPRNSLKSTLFEMAPCNSLPGNDLHP